jgi:hypothetical protein
MSKLVYLWFAVKTVFCTCQSDHKDNGFDKVRSQYKITKIGKLPAVANESSGLANAKRPDSFWTHNDSGGKPELYEIDEKGKLLSVRPVTNASNVDWEDLAEDNDGNVFIGDFGNNGNARKDLTIYKLPKDQLTAEKITFSYTSQTEFPPSQEKRYYDSEAFFHYNSQLYLFSKNRSTKDDLVHLYKLSDRPGNYQLSATDSISINTQVTSADISPDGKTFALLTYGKVLLFSIENGEVNFKRPLGCFRMVKKQAEALLFLNNNHIMITNEQGVIYRISRQ